VRRAGAVLALAVTTGLAALVMAPVQPSSADQLADAQAQAAALSAKLNAEQGQIQSLTGQYDQANYQLSQVNASISATQAQLAKDQQVVNKDESDLKVQAINDYISDGTTSQLTQMFSGDSNTVNIRNEYSVISSGNVTNTVDSLHTAQGHLQTQESALQQQQAEAAAAANALANSKSQADALAAQLQQQSAQANAQVKNIIAQQQAAAAAAAAAAAKAKIAAAQAAQAAAQQAQAAAAAAGGGGGGGSTGSSGGGSSAGPTVGAGPLPPLPPGAAGAVEAAQHEIGVPYVWGGSTPAGFDCSGLVMWAYAQVGISLPHYSGGQYDDTTQIPLADIEPGDLLFYGPGGSEHVAMYIGGGEMVEAPYTGATVHDTPIRTGAGFAGVGRVN
jgi:cell wall-associated NlpC family hydrolase